MKKLFDDTKMSFQINIISVIKYARDLICHFLENRALGLPTDPRQNERIEAGPSGLSTHGIRAAEESLI